MFHFVDQIIELEPGRHALGLKHVTASDVFLRPTPGGNGVLLPSILGEALGQLGAWNVMAVRDFAVRPVAGVVGEVAIMGRAAVGDTVLLDTTIDSVTDDAVFYHAVASVAGATVLTLQDTLGPLLSVEEFNDPGELRRHFGRIYRPGPPCEPPAHDGSAASLFDPSFDEVLSMTRGEEATAVRVLSGNEAFLADHFPKKPVLPLSLLLESILELGGELLEDGGERLVPTVARRVKMSRFVEPGFPLVARIQVAERSAERAVLRFRCEVDGSRACVGEVVFAAAVGGGE